MSTASDIQAYVDEVWPSVVEDIADLVAVESVEDFSTAGPGKPFGDGPRKALDVALGKAAEMGFETHDLDGYIGYATLPGASDKVLATIAHVDVVPAGEGWSGDPFSLQRRDGYLIGRGVIDDKGPFVLSLWAAEYYRRKGVQLPYTLNVIAGVNEETGMKDVEHYLERVGEPAFLFTPDAEFPVGHGEKGRFATTFVSGPIAGGRLVSVTGGTVANAIPGKAVAVVRADPESLPAAERITVEPADEPGCAKIVAQGIGGHASLPAGTVNAIGVLTDYLYENHLYGDRQPRFVDFERLLCDSTDGKALGIDCSDDLFDALTLCAGVVRTTEDGRFTQTIDIRFPTAVTSDHLHAVLFKVAELHGMRMEAPDVQEPFYVEADSPEIQVLLGAYNDRTGENGEAFTMGGGTYARHFARAASFGPETDAETPDWVGSMHGPDEGVSEEQLKDALTIYIDAIGRLMELPDLGGQQ